MPLLLEDVLVNEDKINWLISLYNRNCILKAFLLILVCLGFFFSPEFCVHTGEDMYSLTAALWDSSKE